MSLGLLFRRSPLCQTFVKNSGWQPCHWKCIQISFFKNISLSYVKNKRKQTSKWWAKLREGRWREGGRTLFQLRGRNRMDEDRRFWHNWPSRQLGIWLFLMSPRLFPMFGPGPPVPSMWARTLGVKPRANLHFDWPDWGFVLPHGAGRVSDPWPPNQPTSLCWCVSAQTLSLTHIQCFSH